MQKYPTILNRTSQKLKVSFNFAVTISLLKTRRYQTIIVISALIYAFAYMFFLGIISYYPGVTSGMTTTYPVVRATSYGISIIPAPNFFVFFFYQTIAYILMSSFLVGLNTALMFYSRKLDKSCKINRLDARGVFGILPAFFTSFACCGGGLLALVIGSTAFSSLVLYSKYMAPLAIAALSASTILALKKIGSKDISRMEVDENESRSR